MIHLPQAHLVLAPALVIGAVLAGGLPLVLFALRQGGGVLMDASVWRVLSFTLWQAGLSTLISIAIALPAARALAWRRFAGRDWLMALLALPQSLPSIVVVLALVELYGAAGWFGGLFNLYGLTGILLAHVFFNAPLAIRFFVEALDEIAPENLRLAEQLGFGAAARWKHVEWPLLKPVLPRVAALIFLLCAASFIVVLTLGGPAATTLEVAIFQSLRMDFDVTRAVSLSLLQIVLCLLLVLAAGHLAAPAPTFARLRFTISDRPVSWAGILAVFVVAALLVPPLLALAASGVVNFHPRAALAEAMATSLLIAGLSAILTLLLAWPIAGLSIRVPAWRGRLIAVSLLGLIVPPAVMATGWFILLRGLAPGATTSVLLIAALNGLMALPFATTLLTSGMSGILPHHDRLCAQLGIRGIQRLLKIDLPALARPLAQAGLMAFVMSFGDLTAVMLLGSQGLTTLPSLVASELGNYRSGSAQGTALVLAALCLAGTVFANRLGRSHDQI